MKRLRVLIGCEESGTVRLSFLKLGHDAWSCDLLPSRNPGPHLCGDIRQFLSMEWDLIIAHPPCTRLANSGVLRLFKDGKKSNGIDPVKWAEMIDGTDLFRSIWMADCRHISIENPVMHGHAKTAIGIGMSYQQSIQPYQFGHPESKRTCLWLKGLPNLKPTNLVNLPECGYWENQTPSGQNKLGPSKDRARIRSITYSGIANAMAEQWSQFLS